MLKRVLFIIILISFFLSNKSEGQISVKDSCVFAPLFIATYAIQLPDQDMALRFGLNSNIGFQTLIKTRKNILYGAGGTFIFGNKVKENDMLDGLKTETGIIINVDGQPAEYYFYERGFHLAGYLGKVFPVYSPNKNSGPFVLGSLGFLQHKIKIDDIHRDIRGLSKEYKKGYDRLTNGFAASQLVGYQYLSNRRMLNFYLGFEIIEGFTKNRRSYNYDEMRRDDSNRFDVLYGIRFGWIIPGYKKTPRDFYFN